MFRWRFLVLPVMLGLLVVPQGASWADDDHDHEKDDPAIQYRIDVMKGISFNAAAIGLTLRHKLPQTQNLANHAEAIALGARSSLSAFEPKVAGALAKPEVWENWKDFSARLTKLADAADDVAKTAREQGPAAAMPKLQGMFAGCKDCHDTYRKK
jgi:cytochrome c556